MTMDDKSMLCPTCGGLLDSHATCLVCGQVTDRRIGITLGDRFKVGALIGQGGMGRVYEASHVELGELAVKFLLRELCGSAEIRSRFRREGHILARLRHPSIVGVVDIGEHEGELYMILERLHGQTLGDHLAKTGHVPLHRLGRMFDQILEVVDLAHRNGIIHRDLKPDNVMLVENDRVKVLDFGLALIDDISQPRLAQSGNAHGTPAYMSPEQCRGREVGPKTDVYAVGTMLYEALTGRTPFVASEVAAFFAMHMFIEPATFAEVLPDRQIPPAIEAVVRAALAKDAATRPTAAELRTMLASAMRGMEDAPVRAHVQAEGEDQPAGGGGTTQRTVAGHAVIVWAPAVGRATALRETLISNGFVAEHWRNTNIPPSEIYGKPLRAIVVIAEPDGALRVRMLRESAALAKVPVFVVDALDAKQTVELIRAGASDAAPDGTDDTEVCKSVARLIRRGR